MAPLLKGSKKPAQPLGANVECTVNLVIADGHCESEYVWANP